MTTVETTAYTAASGRADVWDRAAVLQRYRRHVNRGLARLSQLMDAPLEVRSAGCLVYDEQGQAYLDCGGYGVFILGHTHPDVVEAVKRQLELHPLSTRVLLNPTLAGAAEALAAVAPPGLDYVFFTNSGAEATEVGIKLARLNGAVRLIAMQRGFHGKTMGALSVTHRPQFQTPFEPLLPAVQAVPFGDLGALQQAVTATAERCCVILEPVQAEGGVIVPPDGYLRGVKELCTRHHAFLILDEIQTGLGRLGTWWGADREGVAPDVLLVGKGLSGGAVPVGAAVATPAAFEALNRDPMLHTSTFAGNPLAMAAAHAAIGVIGRDGLVERAQALGHTILTAVRQSIAASCPGLVREVRGLGLLIGIEFERDYLAGDFMLELLQRKVIVSHSLNSHGVVRLTPPAVLDDAECDWLLSAVDQAARELGRRHAALAG